MCAWPNSTFSRKSLIAVPSRMSWKYQAPSTVSPYSTAPLNFVASDDELLVDAARRVLEHELLGAGAAREVAGREQVDARDLELRRRLRARVAADAELREMIRDDLRLLEQRRDEAVAGAAVLHALAERVDARVVGLHRVVDEHAALARDAARLRERDVRPDADRHDDEIGRHLAAVART